MGGTVGVVDVRDEAATAAMRDGLRHLDAGSRGAIDALACFARALALRQQTETHDGLWRRYDLAGTWINIATARLLLGRDVDLSEAVLACDAAIARLRELTALDPRCCRRLAIAYHTRGRAGQKRGHDVREAGADYAAAIATLEADEARLVPDRAYLLAASWVGLADVCASDGSADGRSRALHAAGQALALVRELETADDRAAEVALLARHAACRALAVTLAAGGPSRSGPDDPVHFATDAADEGLALVRLWEQRGVTRFRQIACDLYRFGVAVYARYQPHFVGEYVADFAADAAQWADPSVADGRTPDALPHGSFVATAFVPAAQNTPPAFE